MQADNDKDPLLSNKIAAAALTVLLLIFGLPHVAGLIIGGGGHHGGEGEELHFAYGGEINLDLSAGGAEPEVKIDLGTLLAGASVAAGERRSAICKSCHTFEEGGANGTGPNLYNVVNRSVGATPGFNYTAALSSDGGVWSYERLDQYLENSQAYIPGTNMVQRFPKDDQRADLLAYLGSLSPNPVPFPEPAPAPEIEDAGEATEAAEETTGDH